MDKCLTGNFAYQLGIRPKCEKMNVTLKREVQMTFKVEVDDLREKPVARESY